MNEVRVCTFEYYMMKKFEKITVLGVDCKKIERISEKGTLNERLGGEVMDLMKKKCSIDRK